MSKTDRAHWEDAWSKPPRMRLPKMWLVSTADRIRIVGRELRPGARFLEIGCAPGKLLAYVAVKHGVRAAGLDSSERGIAWTRQLFESLGVAADLRHEDVFATTFEAGSFDVVHSAGLIEHFEDPLPLIEIHLRLLRPGGVVLMSVPNFGGLYGMLARRFAPRNLGLHNAATTSDTGLRRLAEPFAPGMASVQSYGRLSVSAVQFEETLGNGLARLILELVNGVGLLQLREVPSLCPQLLLRIAKPGGAWQM